MTQLNDEIADYWKANKGCSALFDLLPSLLEPVEKGSILYVGLNPSYQKNKCLEYDGEKIQSHVKDRLIQEQQNSRVRGNSFYGPYFNQILSFHERLETHRTAAHTDLFHFRRTNSKSEDVTNLIYSSNGEEPSEFAKWSVDLWSRYLVEIDPAFVIVANAVSSNIVKSVLRDQLRFSEQNGVNFLENGKRVPILFTGTWQYGRLDNHTRALLLWVVRRYLHQHAKVQGVRPSSDN